MCIRDSYHRSLGTASVCGVGPRKGKGRGRREGEGRLACHTFLGPGVGQGAEMQSSISQLSICRSNRQRQPLCVNDSR